LALSGGVFAAALQIKLTAAVVAPALVVEVVLGAQGLTKASRVKEAARALGIWGGSVVCAYLGLVAALGTVPLDVLWASHFSPETLAQAKSLAFSQRLVLEHTEVVWAAAAGLLLLSWRCDWHRMAFPLVWLLTVILVHLEHRPWWSYYYLHFAVPLAWLSGYGMAELLRIAWAMPAGRALWVRLRTYGCIGLTSLLLALVAVYGGERLIAEVKRIRALPRVEESTLVAKMRQYADRTRWVYAWQNIYAFHAGLTVVPELAVMPRKRFWSGQITDEQIWATVKRYRPEQLLLGDRPLDAGISEFLKAGYTLVYQDGEYALHVAKSLAVHEP
jgi:hypothetical protein